MVPNYTKIPPFECWLKKKNKKNLGIILELNGCIQVSRPLGIIIKLKENVK